MALSIEPATGSQINTQSPQASVGSGTKTAAASKVQPGTATSVLSSSGGVRLSNATLPSVNLNDFNNVSTSTGQTAAAVNIKPHKLDTPLLILPALLVAVALGLFWFTKRSVKSTTEY